MGMLDLNGTAKFRGGEGAGSVCGDGRPSGLTGAEKSGRPPHKQAFTLKRLAEKGSVRPLQFYTFPMWDSLTSMPHLQTIYLDRPERMTTTGLSQEFESLWTAEGGIQVVVRVMESALSEIGKRKTPYKVVSSMSKLVAGLDLLTVLYVMIEHSRDYAASDVPDDGFKAVFGRAVKNALSVRTEPPMGKGADACASAHFASKEDPQWAVSGNTVESMEALVRKRKFVS